MADFNITPYSGAQYIYRGFESAADSIARARAQQIQQQQFQQQLAMEQKRLDLGYYSNDATNARDYYGLDLKKQELEDARTSREQIRADALDEKKREYDAAHDPAALAPQPLTYNGQVVGMVVPGAKAVKWGDPTASSADQDQIMNLGGGKAMVMKGGKQQLVPKYFPGVMGQSPDTITDDQRRTWLTKLQQDVATGGPAAALGYSGGDLPGETRQQAMNRIQAELDYPVGQWVPLGSTVQKKPATGSAAPAAAAAPTSPPLSFLGAPIVPVRASAPAATPLTPTLPAGPGQAPSTLALMPSSPQFPMASGDLTAAAPGLVAEPVAAGPKALDAGTAAQFLQQAGGDRDKARQLARQAGYAF